MDIIKTIVCNVGRSVSLCRTSNVHRSKSVAILPCQCQIIQRLPPYRRQLIQGLVPPPAPIEDNITAKSSKAFLRQLHLQPNHPKNRPRKEYHSILHPPNSNESKVTANTRYFSEKKKRISNKNEKNIK